VETTTTSSRPCTVTSCGPSLFARRTSSLKRALASCSSQRPGRDRRGCLGPLFFSFGGELKIFIILYIFFFANPRAVPAHAGAATAVGPCIRPMMRQGCRLQVEGAPTSRRLRAALAGPSDIFLRKNSLRIAKHGTVAAPAAMIADRRCDGIGHADSNGVSAAM